ncbi:phosphoethanolamine transferase [Dysgonomonas sp. 511]|uniref:phosphoethanolamine transferase n=1 Tax=Dysgonomonas sp. 511 TaxID=2302930 RepID=UPI0013D288BF|nr:phosphoethanolamine transferase [Dysgonomonas sp. 511]NDV79155.1 hypothetical protein [Dysgonomonas sp. 511]
MPEKKHLAKKFGEAIYKYKFTIVALAYIGLIAFIPIRFAPSIPMLLLVLSFLPLVNILAKTRYTFILTFLLAFILAFNAYFAFALGTDVSLEVMASIFETHTAEAVSMLKGGVLLGALLGLAATTGLLYLAERELKGSPLSRKVSLGLLLAYLLLFLPIVCYKRIKWDRQAEFMAEAPLKVVQDKVNMYAPILYGNILTILAYQEEMAMLREFSDPTNKTLPEGIVLNDTLPVPQKIYLVIGESAYRKHWSLYGYPVKTTPFIDSLSQVQPQQMYYYDGIASAPFTRNALRMALSFASPVDLQPFYENKTLINMANDAGYATYWISNQGSSAIEDSYLGYIAASANHTIYPKGNYMANDDFVLLSILRAERKEKEKQFFVLHLVGSHNDYSDRYDQTDAETISGNNTVTNQYDRSIHHTDRVLREIYQVMTQDSTALLLFFSDHGEIVGKGHGPWKDGVAQFDIPFVAIENGVQPTGRIIAKYQDKETGLVNNSNIVYILAEAMGYSIPHRYIEKAVSDGRFVRHADQSFSPYSEIKD